MKRLIEVKSWDEVPAFDSDADAERFWATHTLAPALLARARRGPPADVAAILGRRARPVDVIIELPRNVVLARGEGGRFVRTDAKIAAGIVRAPSKQVRKAVREESTLSRRRRTSPSSDR